MEICFIPDKDYLGWLGKRRSLPGEGDLIFHGDVVGKHKGICAYTVGQRMPGLLNERKVYISKIDAVRNTVELALWEELFKYEVSQGFQLAYQQARCSAEGTGQGAAHKMGKSRL
jgi:tRNA-specific 2-thiouridylase